MNDRMASGRGIPLTVIGGFLGAGKTTAVNALLAGVRDQRIAVLVNDFGGLAIDAALIAERNATTIALTNGCVCCSLASGLVNALLDVLALEPPPDRIVVEASGVSEPRRIAQVARADAALAPDATIVLVAADQWPSLSTDRYVGDVVRRQVEGADVVVLNKVDLVEPREIALLQAQLRALAPRAPLVEAEGARLPYADLMGFGLDAKLRAATRGAEVSLKAGDVGHDRLFATRLMRSVAPVSAPRLRDALQRLPASVIRAKGFVRLDDAPHAWQLVQVVGRRWSLVPAEPLDAGATSALVVMGPAATLDDESLQPLAAAFESPLSSASAPRASRPAPAARGR